MGLVVRKPDFIVCMHIRAVWSAPLLIVIRNGEVLYLNLLLAKFPYSSLDLHARIQNFFSEGVQLESDFVIFSWWREEEPKYHYNGPS